MTTWSPFDTDWSNFQNWLNSGSGKIIYLIGFVTILIYVLLFWNMREFRQMRRLPAMMIWLGICLLPIILLVTLTVSYAVYFCSPPVAVILSVGLVILALPKASHGAAAQDTLADEFEGEKALLPRGDE